jgi:hypothetical protein
MTTRDVFSDMLAEHPISARMKPEHRDKLAAIARADLERSRLLPHERAMLAHDGYLVNDPRKSTPTPPTTPAPAPAIRPVFADDIDRLVSELVYAGDVVLDRETDQYRAPHYRRFRFGT